MQEVCAGRGRGRRHRLPYSVLDALVQHARVEKLVEVRGAGGAGTAGYRYALTDLGRERGDAVPRHQPLRRTGAGAAGAVQRLRPRLHGGAAVGRSRLPVDAASTSSSSTRAMYDQLGPAVNSGKSLFLYGAPGNGKTVVAEGHRPRARQRHARAARDRRRRPDDHHLRSGQPRRRRRRPARRRASSPPRSTIAAGSRSGARWWWSAAS